jgi:DNA-directed RNA polymerase subunit RPC12/RpoP
MSGDDLRCPRCGSDDLEETRRPTEELTVLRGTHGDVERVTGMTGHYKCESCSWAGDLALPVAYWPRNLRI